MVTLFQIVKFAYEHSVMLFWHLHTAKEKGKVKP